MINTSSKLILILSFSLSGCLQASHDSNKNETLRAVGCRIPSTEYDPPTNPYPSRFILSKNEFDNASNNARKGDGSASFSIANHIWNQRNADAEAALCWFIQSRKQGYEPASAKIVMISLSEAQNSCRIANEYSDKNEIIKSEIGNAWSKVLESCKKMIAINNDN